MANSGNEQQDLQDANAARNLYNGINGIRGGVGAASSGGAVAGGTSAGRGVGAASSGGAVAGGASAGGAVGAAITVAADQLKDEKGAQTVGTVAGCCGCCGCSCSSVFLSLMLIISIMFTQLSPSYMLGNLYADFMSGLNTAETKRQEEEINKFADKIMGVYESSYNDALTACRDEIGGKKSAYSNAYLQSGSNRYLTIKDTMSGMNDNGAAYGFSNNNSIQIKDEEGNLRTISSKYEYMITQPDGFDGQTKNLKNIANVPYIVASYDYYISTHEEYERTSFWQKVLGKIGDIFHFSDEAKLRDNILKELSGKLSSGKKNTDEHDKGLFGYTVLETDKMTVDGSNVDVEYEYKTADVTYSIVNSNNSTAYAIRDDDGNLRSADKGTPGAQRLDSFIDPQDYEAISDFNDSSDNSVKTKKTVTYDNSETVKGIFYVGVVYTNDLYVLLADIFDFDISTEDGQTAISEISEKSGMFEDYSKTKLDSAYLKDSLGAVITCNGSVIPKYFGQEEKTNYGLVAWAKMANTYDPNTTDEKGMDTPARWGYVWGHRGTRFTAEEFTRIGDNQKNTQNSANHDTHYDNINLYLSTGKWIGHRAADCNGLCVGYLACHLTDSGEVAISGGDEDFSYTVTDTVAKMKEQGRAPSDISAFDEKLIGQVLMLYKSDGKSYQHIGIYCGFNEVTNMYEVIHASGEVSGVIKSSYATVDELKGDWDECGQLYNVTYYKDDEYYRNAKTREEKAEATEAKNAKSEAEVAIAGITKTVENKDGAETDSLS